ncbi:hypothetical protein EYF80_028405 [Liparis tanakae]|uniref:Uncharacterized protein n=1 Tax=Liparis tanakae TaxID=230148 RepID=A0A4Z2H668_9TELE|nr:hypothetical protein EYF80_028405 [Liparis tanakae]
MFLLLRAELRGAVKRIRRSVSPARNSDRRTMQRGNGPAFHPPRKKENAPHGKCGRGLYCRLESRRVSSGKSCSASNANNSK